MAASAPQTVAFAIGGPITRADLPGLCAHICTLLERSGADVPPDDSDVHLPRARFHALLAHGFGPAELVEPVYVRAPDADRMLA